MMKLTLLVFIALLGGCASLTATDTVPLTANELAPSGSAVISRGGYRLSDLAPQPGQHPDLMVLVAMSGGGKRSASFGYGALKGMREVSVPFAEGPRPLLQVVDVVCHGVVP